MRSADLPAHRTLRLLGGTLTARAGYARYDGPDGPGLVLVSGPPPAPR